MKPPEKDVSPLLHAALAAQRQGAIRDARRLYEQALRAAPRHPDALHLLGLTWLDDGQAERGLQLIRRAIAYRPDYLEAINNIAIELAKLDRHAEAQGFLEKALRLNEAQPDVHYNLGRSLNALGRFAQALESYDRALALRAGHHETWNNRGITLHALRRHEEAIASYDRALALKPDYHEAWTNRGLCLHDMKRFDDALASYDNAITARPEHFQAWLNRADTLLETRQYEDALRSLDRASVIKADDAGVLSRRAIALTHLKQYDDALACADKALALDPKLVDGHIARCAALRRLRRLEEALGCTTRALSIDPGHVLAWSNHGVTLHELKRTDEAIAAYDRAISLHPEQAEAHQARAYSLLALGRFAEGWRDHEYRWAAWGFEAKRPTTVGAPHWQGEDLAGRHILVYTEQGMGDTMQFARYLPLLQNRGARVTFLSPANMHRLLRPHLPAVTLIGNEAEAGSPDFQVATMSLPHVLQTDMATIPGGVPYLAAEPGLRARWGDRLGTRGYRIGIAWQGNPAGGVDTGRSIALRQFAELADLPDVRLISLQIGFGLEQLSGLPAGMVVETLGEDFDAGPDAFIDTAAVMENLDLVVSSDTSVVHLAGALGRPVWVALQHVPDWRWLQDRTDTPWYPTMRLFRQTRRGDWDDVFRDMRRALEEVL